MKLSGMNIPKTHPSKKFIYISSGMSYTVRKRFTRETELATAELLTSMALKTSELYKEHSFGYLVNALTEKGLGETLNNIYDNKLLVIGDSGGLQAITLGKKSDDLMKNGVYQTQSQLVDFAMSFDEIPVTLTSNRSTFHDTASRFFDPTIFDEKARQSGENLKKQIEYFKKVGTTSKPFLIVQGNSMAYYQRWIDIILDTVGEDNHKYIGGIASGAAALGQGKLEDVKRIWYLTKLNAPDHIKSVIHVLGLGAISRLLPLVAFKMGGYFPDTVFTYDSTTHTSGLSNGNFTKGYGLHSLSRVRDANYMRLIQYYIETAKKTFGIDLKEDMVFNLICRPIDEYYALYGKDVYNQHLTLNGMFYTSVSLFLESFEKVLESEHNFIDACKGLDHIYMPLKNVRDDKDFLEWERKLGCNLPSKAVPVREQLIELDF